MVRGWNHLETGSFWTRPWRRALIFLTVIGLGVLGVGAAFAQDGLSVAIRTDREVYPAGDPVKVTYTVTNQTGQTIHLEGSGCVPLFNLVAYNADGQEIWNAAQCPLCCCTCCQCPEPPNIERDIPPGDSSYPNDTTWRQVQTVQRDLCGCQTQSVEPGVYYLIGQISNTVVSDPVVIEIQ